MRRDGGQKGLKNFQFWEYGNRMEGLNGGIAIWAVKCIGERVTC